MPWGMLRLFQIYITSVNGRYKFDNTIDMAHRMFKYVPIHISTGDNQLEANFKMMRLVLDHTSILTIEEPAISRVIYNQDMIENIRLNPKYSSQENIDREDTFVFEINITKNDHDIVISLLVNGWKIKDVIPVIN